LKERYDKRGKPNRATGPEKRTLKSVAYKRKDSNEFEEKLVSDEKEFQTKTVEGQQEGRSWDHDKFEVINRSPSPTDAKFKPRASPTYRKHEDEP